MTAARKASKGHWLVKQEPEGYSWDDLVREGSTQWTGVRNFQARNNLRQMKAGDEVLFYHSGKEKSVVGIARVSKAAYPDPTTKEKGWTAVDIKPFRKLAKPVSLADIKSNANLKDLLLVRQSRLSVMPISVVDFETIVRLGT